MKEDRQECPEKEGKTFEVIRNLVVLDRIERKAILAIKDKRVIHSSLIKKNLGRINILIIFGYIVQTFVYFKEFFFFLYWVYQN